jgi:hypothetical protein
MQKGFFHNALETTSKLSFAPQTMYSANDDQPQVKHKNRLD